MKTSCQDTKSTIDEFLVNAKVIENVWYLFKKISKWNPVMLFLIFIQSISIATKTFLIAYIPKVVIDYIIRQQSGSNSDTNFYFILIGIILIKIFITMLNQWAELSLGWRYIYIRMKFVLIRIRKAITMDYEMLEQPKMLDKMQKACNAANGNNDGIEGVIRSVSELSGNLFTLLMASIAMAIFDIKIIIVIVCFAFLTYFFLNKARKEDKKELWDAMTPIWRREHYLVNTTKDFAYAKDIRLFSMQNWLKIKLRRLNHEAHLIFRKHFYRWFKYGTIMQLFTFVQEVLVYVWLIISVVNGSLSIGNFTMYIIIAKTFFDAVVSFFNVLSSLQLDNALVNDFRSFVEYPGRVNILAAAQIIPRAPQYAFKFENVSFQYNGATDYALSNLDLTIRAGERIAVVGLNGAGKTTFIKLLCRLYEPTEGRILMNDINIQDFDRNTYYEHIAPVFQNVECFALPISENVSMKSPKETDKIRAEEMLQKAGLGNKIASLEEGVQTELLKILSDKGIDLSGGEKQKLALARALYKDAPLVILDEPTSALDALAEEKLYKDFDKLIGDKTAVYISHRLSSTRFCDKIVMFENGQIVAYGSHEELVREQGPYTELYELQARYYRTRGETKNA